MLSSRSKPGSSLWAALLLLLLGSCADAAEDPDLSFSTEWLTPSGSLPPELSELRVTVFVEGETEPQQSTFTVMGLMDLDGDMRPELSRGGLPFGTPIEIEILGFAGAVEAYRGRVGPFVLAPGERRHVDLRMYPLDDAVLLEGAEVPSAMLPTATALRDGRVLVAGGFSAAEPLASCPVELPAMARCFELTASREGWLFDPSAGAFHRVRSPMLQARGGHTATALPDGRVLLAGGSDKALFALIPQGSAGTTGFTPVFTPLDGEGEAAAHATFELFDPGIGGETSDPDRDGDPARGGFVGSADSPAEPGRLNQERFLHAASTIPAQDGRVLLVGGLGADGGAGSYEVYDHQKAGGYGVYGNTGARLRAARGVPGAFPVTVPEPGRVWIVGGGTATDNASLAEVWEPTVGDPNGVTTPASEVSNYPDPSVGNLMPRPYYNLLRPDVAPLNNGTHGLVSGWFGPRCAPESTVPAFPSELEAQEACGHDGGPPRGHTIAAATGLTLGTSTTQPHAFGASTALDDGAVVISGGLASIIWNATPVMEIFTGAIDSTGIALRAPATVNMTVARSMHATAPLRGKGMLIVGGVTVSTDASRLTLVGSPEAVYLR